MNLELLRAWGSQTTSAHTFPASQAMLPSLLPSRKEDGRPPAESASDCFGSRKNRWRNL